VNATTTAAPLGRIGDGLAGLLANTATVTGRNLHRLVRVPTLIAFATVQPVMFVLLFTYAFGGAIHPPGVAHYVDYLLPGIFVLAIAFGASQTGVAIADDLASGMIDRFHAGPAAATATIALALAIGVAFSWINALLGLLVRDAESAGLAGLLAVIPLIFTSSTFVPIATMPGWLQAFAKVNPITITVDALRALCLGGPTATHLWQALAWTGGLLLVTVPAAVIGYRHTTAA
jgi:ABC-type polysaccharide/polyol phosphate export permease